MSIVTGSVLAWSPYVETVEELEREDVLALIFIESTGNPNAVRGDTYFGLLQISDAYMQDALDFAGRDFMPARALVGDGIMSIRIFRWYMQRYESVHEWDPVMAALLHKMGPAGLKRVISNMTMGMNIYEAVEADSTPGALEYLIRFENAREAYREREGFSG